MHTDTLTYTSISRLLMSKIDDFFQTVALRKLIVSNDADTRGRIASERNILVLATAPDTRRQKRLQWGCRGCPFLLWPGGRHLPSWCCQNAPPPSIEKAPIRDPSILWTDFPQASGKHSQICWCSFSRPASQRLPKLQCIPKPKWEWFENELIF